MKSVKLLLLAFFVVISASGYAQHNAFNGYIIDLQGNKIHGMIDFNTNAVLAKECSFSDDNSQYHTYVPGEILGFMFDHNGKFYVTRSFTIHGDKVTAFAEYIVQGKMNLYLIERNGNAFYIFEKENGETSIFTTYPYFAHYTELQKNQAKREVGELRYLLRDSPKAMAEVKSTYIEKDKLIRIARKYHEEMSSDGTECTVFELNEKSAKERIGYKVFANYLFVGTDDEHLTPFGIGAGAEFPLHRIRKGTRLELGLSLSAYSHDTEEILWRGYSNERTVNMNYKGICLTLNVGPKLSFGSGKIKPIVRFGGYGMLLTAHKSSTEASDSEIEQEQPIVIPGLYAGGGVAFSVGKNKELTVHADALPIVGPGIIHFTNFALVAEFSF